MVVKMSGKRRMWEKGHGWAYHAALHGLLIVRGARKESSPSAMGNARPDRATWLSGRYC